MPKWLTYVNSWSEFRRLLLIIVPVTAGIAGGAFGISKIYINKQIEENTEEIQLNETLKDLATGQTTAASTAHANTIKIDSALMILGGIRGEITTMQAQQVKQDKKIDDAIEVAKFWWENKNDFTEEQMDKLIDRWLKKNEELKAPVETLSSGSAEPG